LTLTGHELKVVISRHLRQDRVKSNFIASAHDKSDGMYVNSVRKPPICMKLGVIVANRK